MLLVTGGAGFIGSNFVLSTIAETGETVVNLDKLTYAGNLRNLDSLGEDRRHAFVHGDICDREVVRKLLSKHKPRAGAPGGRRPVRRANFKRRHRRGHGTRAAGSRPGRSLPHERRWANHLV